MIHSVQPKFNGMPQHYVPQQKKTFGGPSVNLSFGSLPRQPQFQQPLPPNKNPNFSPLKQSREHPVETESKERVKEMTSDLARLKRQLNDIMKEADNKKNFYEEKRHNRSSDNLYAPHQRI